MKIPTLSRQYGQPAARLLCLLAAFGLSACDMNEQTAFAPNCSGADIPAAAADYYVYEGAQPDFGHLVTKAAILGLSGACQSGPKGQGGVRSSVSVHMAVTRGPAAQQDSVDIPFFIAVVHNDKIIDKKIFTQTVTFSPNMPDADVSSRVLIIDLPDAARQDPDSYRLEVGFQLTQQQLTYNRSHLVPPSFKPL